MAPRIPATEEDWDTEYLDTVLSVKIVDGLEEAINWVTAHSSHHTDAIVTAGATLTALWDMLYEESAAAFNPDDLVRCARETPGEPALPEDILELSVVFDPKTGCHTKAGAQGMRLAPPGAGRRGPRCGWPRRTA